MCQLRYHNCLTEKVTIEAQALWPPLVPAQHPPQLCCEQVLCSQGDAGSQASGRITVADSRAQTREGCRRRGSPEGGGGLLHTDKLRQAGTHLHACIMHALGHLTPVQRAGPGNPGSECCTRPDTMPQVSGYTVAGYTMPQVSGYTMHQVSGYTRPPVQGTSCIRFQGTPCIRFQGTPCIRFQGTTGLRFQGTPGLRFQGTPCIRFQGVSGYPRPHVGF